MSRPSRTSPPAAAQAFAQAREARLGAVLAGMAGTAPSLEPVPLAAFRAAIFAGRIEEATAGLPELERGGFIEEAMGILREARRGTRQVSPLQSLMQRASGLAETSRSRRAATWQLDTRKTSVRFCYSKRTGVLDLDTGDLQRVFLAALRLEGLLVAQDLGHHPRPLLQLGPALPSGVGGEEEWGDVTLRRPPGDPEALLPALNARLPEGLHLHRWEVQPGYASPVAELAQRFEWAWECPADWLKEARGSTDRFLASASFPWVRAGKVDGQKQGKQVDLRPLVDSMSWEGPRLRFITPMRTFGATNPLKALGAILGRDPETLEGLVRVSLHLGTDPRITQGERFEPKLRNLYEDAVLLSGGSNITLVEEEDDEPLHLG